MGWQYTTLHAADLVAMLPAHSRVMCALDSRFGWDQETYLLANIEYWVHCLVWVQTKDAKYKRNQPELIKPPDQKKQEKKQVDVAALKASLARPRKAVEIDGH